MPKQKLSRLSLGIGRYQLCETNNWCHHMPKGKIYIYSYIRIRQIILHNCFFVIHKLNNIYLEISLGIGRYQIY